MSSPARTRTAPTRRSLTVEDWIEAGLDVISCGGVEAVAVEPLARRLNVTKGSFYWHFTSRDALVARSLQVWERRQTVDMLAHAEQHAQPRDRIRALLHAAANTDKRSEQILLWLLTSDHPATRSCVKRVADLWRAYLERCYRALGLAPTAAQQWSTLAYSTFIGTLRMRRDEPAALPAGPQFNEYLRFLIGVLLPPQPSDHAQADLRRVVPMHDRGNQAL